MQNTQYFGFPLFEENDKPSWLTDWNGLVEELDNLLEENKELVQAHDGHISSLQTNVNKINATLDSMNTIIDSMQEYEGNLGGRLNVVETTLVEIDTEVKSLATRVADVEGELATTIQTITSNVAQQISQMEANVSSQISSMESDVASQISSMESNVASQISQLESDVDSELEKVKPVLYTQYATGESYSVGDLFEYNNDVYYVRTTILSSDNTSFSNISDRVTKFSELSDYLKHEYSAFGRISCFNEEITINSRQIEKHSEELLNIREVISPKYDATRSYDRGEYVRVDDGLYFRLYRANTYVLPGYSPTGEGSEYWDSITHTTIKEFLTDSLNTKIAPASPSIHNQVPDVNSQDMAFAVAFLNKAFDRYGAIAISNVAISIQGDYTANFTPNVTTCEFSLGAYLSATEYDKLATVSAVANNVRYDAASGNTILDFRVPTGIVKISDFKSANLDHLLQNEHNGWVLFISRSLLANTGTSRTYAGCYVYYTPYETYSRR